MRRLMGGNPRQEQRRQARLLDRLERQFRPRFAAEIQRAVAELVDQYEATGEVGAARDHHEAIERLFASMAVASVEAFGLRIVEQGKALGRIEVKETFTERFRRFALSYVSREAVRRKISSISETTRAQIVGEVSRGYSAGQSVAEIARGIRERAPALARVRAAVIARTETHGAAQAGAHEAAKATGLELRKEWVAAEDERTRESHRLADGQTVGMDETFDVGGAAMAYPGDPDAPAAEVVNCRCVSSHIVVEDLD